MDISALFPILIAVHSGISFGQLNWVQPTLQKISPEIDQQLGFIKRKMGNLVFAKNGAAGCL